MNLVNHECSDHGQMLVRYLRAEGFQHNGLWVELGEFRYVEAEPNFVVPGLFAVKLEIIPNDLDSKHTYATAQCFLWSHQKWELMYGFAGSEVQSAISDEKGYDCAADRLRLLRVALWLVKPGLCLEQDRHLPPLQRKA